jgi:hypothetical protein
MRYRRLTLKIASNVISAHPEGLLLTEEELPVD